MLEEMPVRIKVVKDETPGTLKVTWKGNKATVTKRYASVVNYHVVLHDATTCEGKRTNPIFNFGLADCACPRRMVLGTDCTAVFESLDHNRDYFALVASIRPLERAICGESPTAVQPGNPRVTKIRLREFPPQASSKNLDINAPPLREGQDSTLSISGDPRPPLEVVLAPVRPKNLGMNAPPLSEGHGSPSSIPLTPAPNLGTEMLGEEERREDQREDPPPPPVSQHQPESSVVKTESNMDLQVRVDLMRRWNDWYKKDMPQIVAQTFPTPRMTCVCKVRVSFR